MNEPSLSIIIPTRGTGDLSLTLHSIETQRRNSGDQILVVGDGPCKNVEEQVEALGDPYKYIEGPKTGDWGHAQCNYALGYCTAKFISIQGDDDIFLPRAFEVIRAQLTTSPNRPHMFRFYTNDRWLVWAEEDQRELGPALVGDHNLFAPNVPDRLGRWESHYRGDLAWVRSTSGFYGGSAGLNWSKTIITRQRPDIKLLDWPLHAHPERSAAHSSLHGGGIQLAAPPDDSHPQHQYVFTHRDHPTEYMAASNYYLTPMGFFASFWISRDFIGKGLGKYLIQHAIDAAHGDCYIWIEPNGGKMLAALGHFGFTRRDTKDGKLLMYKEFPV